MDNPENTQSESLTPLHWAVISLAFVTGSIHFLLGVLSVPDPLGIGALLAGGGFVLGIILILQDRYRLFVYLLGIPFVAAQILLWYILNEPASVAEITPLAAIDKFVQTILILLLVVLIFRTRYQ